MRLINLKLYAIPFLLLTGYAIFIGSGSARKSNDSWKPDIPKTWVDAEIDELELPLADPIGSPKHVNAEYYYRIPVRPIYKSYPIYAPGHEPPGYIDRLKRQEPEIVWGKDKKDRKSTRLNSSHLGIS